MAGDRYAVQFDTVTYVNSLNHARIAYSDAFEVLENEYCASLTCKKVNNNELWPPVDGG